MNYISEINNFYDWLETNPISDSAIVLWHALMHVNNKCGWKPEFAVAISTIQNKTGLSESSISRARKALAQAGKIKFTPRPGRQSTIYSFVGLHTDGQTEGLTDQKASESATLNPVGLQYDCQTEGINHVDRQGEGQSGVQTEGLTNFDRHTDGQTEGILKLNNINKKGTEPFFTIGTELIKGNPSERIKSDHEFATDKFMMTIFSGLDKNKILTRLDEEYVGYQFKDEMHLRNSFKTIGEKMVKDAKPKTVYGKPEIPAASNEGFTSMQKPRGAVSHGK